MEEMASAICTCIPTHSPCNLHCILQVAMYRSLLPRTLAQLPGGGCIQGSILEIGDQEQQFKAQLVLSHRVSKLGGCSGA